MTFWISGFKALQGTIQLFAFPFIYRYLQDIQMKSTRRHLTYGAFDLRIWGSHSWAYCLGVTWEPQILKSISRYQEIQKITLFQLKPVPQDDAGTEMLRERQLLDCLIFLAQVHVSRHSWSAPHREFIRVILMQACSLAIGKNERGKNPKLENYSAYFKKVCIFIDNRNIGYYWLNKRL